MWEGPDEEAIRPGGWDCEVCGKKCPAFEYRNGETGKFAAEGEMAFYGVHGVELNGRKLCHGCANTAMVRVTSGVGSEPC